ncbi:MAG: ESX secretion-associated protein EspG [Actinophytocola sp.]|uniref:ESX secretion-associated protein EspG n=1 Tax=Actinophytocola sp. TaxID=1872138 RepID=UPI00132B8CB8|nr:ESX secretion-associated protein EspG [Actinophytocola sp.]MPZ80588.1 ESX secretion-associated protein EspG [Actinophytocola sp.]
MTSTFSIGERETEPITLSALEFDVLWEHLRLGQLPLVVKVPSPGKTVEERAQLEQRAWADLERRGLGRPVEVHPDIEDILTLLAKPDREVDARAYAGRNVRALAAATGEVAGVAELSDGQVKLRHASAAGLPAAALAALPTAVPGPGQSVTLRTVDFENAAITGAGTREGFHKELLSHGTRADDATALAEMIKDVTGMGNFGAAARDKFGRRRRAERVVSFFDTEDGRYVQIRRPAQDGTMWTTISPADPRNLTHYVEEMLDEIVHEAGS